MPDPSVNALHPGLVRPSAKAPLDLGEIVRRPPGALGPRGFMELVPGSGVWVPDPAGPDATRRPPKFPLDVASMVRLAPRRAGSAWLHGAGAGVRGVGSRPGRPPLAG